MPSENRPGTCPAQDARSRRIETSDAQAACEPVPARADLLLRSTGAYPWKDPMPGEALLRASVLDLHSTSKVLTECSQSRRRAIGRGSTRSPMGSILADRRDVSFDWALRANCARRMVSQIDHEEVAGPEDPRQWLGFARHTQSHP